MAKERGEKHRYGQHYTPVSVARLLGALAVRSVTDKILDPACGDGRLLRESLNCKERLSLSDSIALPGANLALDLFGLDRTSSAIDIASSTGTQIACADFFDIEPGASINENFKLPAEFDAMVGNPPYIRHEVIGSKDKRRIEKRLNQGRALSPEIHWPRWSGRSDIYVYFFAHGARFLREGGRLVFLTASSWLDSRYGAPLREFLLNNFRIVAIIESAVESFFADASINTAITVLERESDYFARDNNTARFITLLCPLEVASAESESFLSDLTGSNTSNFNHHSNCQRIRAIRQGYLRDEIFRVESTSGKSSRERSSLTSWGRYLRADDIFFHIIERGGDRLKALSSFAGVRFGVKTGANQFFYVRDTNGDRANAELRALSDVALLRRGITTGANEFFYLKALENDGNYKTAKHKQSALSKSKFIEDVRQVEDGTGERHLIESKYLAPVIFSLKEIETLIIEPGQARRFFFNCPMFPDQLTGSRALEYIRNGERAGYHLRPTCAGRNPWYTAARGMTPAPLIFPAKVGERWIVALNRAGVFEDKKLYGIFPHKDVSVITLAALLNSTWVRYCAEVNCRQMTGAQAIADIDVGVASELLIPDPRSLSSVIKRRLESAFIEIARRPVLSVFEEINLPDRRKLDELAVEAIGFDDAAERKDLIERLYAALTDLVRGRLSRKTII